MNTWAGDRPQENVMSETTQSPVTREGKFYGYQKPQESAAGTPPPATDNKQQLISAFEAFIDGLVCRVPTAPTTGTPTTGTPTTGAPTTGTPTTGSTTTTGAPTTGTPMTGTPTT